MVRGVRGGGTLLFGLACGLMLAGCDRGASTPPLAASTPAASASAMAADPMPAQLRQRAEAVLAAHRQMIVLMSGERTLPPDERRAVGSVGQMLFHDLLARQESLLQLAALYGNAQSLPGL
jgi:hypothetical protein